MLNKNGKKYFVINSGVSGWGTLQEITYARDHLSLFNPEIVVLIFTQNDPKDDFLFLNKLKDNDKGIVYIPGKRFLLENSHLFRYLFYRTKSLLRDKILNLLLKDERKSNIIEVSGESKEIKEKQTELNSSKITSEQWSRTKSYILSFYKDYINFNPNGKFLILTASSQDEDVRRNLSSLSDNNRLLYLDISEDEIKIPLKVRWVSESDNHWSPIMMEMVAQNLYEFFVREY